MKNINNSTVPLCPEYGKILCLIYVQWDFIDIRNAIKRAIITIDT